MKYRVITKSALIRRHLMPAAHGQPVTCGKLNYNDVFEGEPFGAWVQIQEPTRSGFVQSECVVAEREPPVSPER